MFNFSEDSGKINHQEHQKTWRVHVTAVTQDPETPSKSAHGSTGQHASAHGSTPEHVSAHGSTRRHVAAHLSTRQHASVHGSTRRHVAAYGSTPQHTSAPFSGFLWRISMFSYNHKTSHVFRCSFITLIVSPTMFLLEFIWQLSSWCV